MDILIIGDGFQTLINVIIVDLIHIDLVQQTLTMTMHVTMMVAQKKM